MWTRNFQGKKYMYISCIMKTILLVIKITICIFFLIWGFIWLSVLYIVCLTFLNRLFSSIRHNRFWQNHLPLDITMLSHNIRQLNMVTFLPSESILWHIFPYIISFFIVHNDSSLFRKILTASGKVDRDAFGNSFSCSFKSSSSLLIIHAPCLSNFRVWTFLIKVNQEKHIERTNFIQRYFHYSTFWWWCLGSDSMCLIFNRIWSSLSLG